MGKYFYSYYVANQCDSDSHSVDERCHSCGHWQKVNTTNNIPKRLLKIKGAWRKHLINPTH